MKQKGEQWRPRKDNSQLVSTIYRLGKSVYRERPATFPHMQNIKIHLWNASGVQPATSSSQHSCCLARARHLEFRSGWQPLCSTATQRGGGGRGHGTRGCGSGGGAKELNGGQCVVRLFPYAKDVAPANKVSPLASKTDGPSESENLC